jgi:hypothetical protein
MSTVKDIVYGISKLEKKQQELQRKRVDLLKKCRSLVRDLNLSIDAYQSKVNRYKKLRRKAALELVRRSEYLATTDSIIARLKASLAVEEERQKEQICQYDDTLSYYYVVEKALSKLLAVPTTVNEQRRNIIQNSGLLSKLRRVNSQLNKTIRRIAEKKRYRSNLRTPTSVFDLIDIHLERAQCTKNA